MYQGHTTITSTHEYTQCNKMQEVVPQFACRRKEWPQGNRLATDLGNLLISILNLDTNFKIEINHDTDNAIQ